MSDENTSKLILLNAIVLVAVIFWVQLNTRYLVLRSEKFVLSGMLEMQGNDGSTVYIPAYKKQRN